jgi:hypothetical protein
MKQVFLFIFTIPCLSVLGCAQGSVAGSASQSAVVKFILQLDRTGKYLVSQITGKPVFLTGEDAWDLSDQVSNSEVQTYLADRAARGFNAIWVGAPAFPFENNAPDNFFGQAPFSGSAFTNENPSFWSHVDYVIHHAADFGITVFLDPGFVGVDSGAGYLTAYENSSCSTLTAYGNFLGSRYANYPNIVWALGGDWWNVNLVSAAKMNCMASGIQAKDAHHLMTAETRRGSSTLDVWKNSTRMSINWVYLWPSDIVSLCSSNFSRSGALPTIDGEDYYEGEHSMTALQVREEGYWGILGGCTAGRLFGNNPIWCFSSTASVDGRIHCNRTPTWQASLNSAGSIAQEYLGRLMRSREFWKMVPDANHVVLTGGYGSGVTLAVGACTSDRQTCIVYDPVGNRQDPQIAMPHFSRKVQGWWFNPSTAAATNLGTFPNSGTRTFRPPDDNDWVLVLDLESAGLPPPGVGSFQ